MKILRIQTSPRGEHSESRKLGDFLVAEAERTNRDVTTIVRDVSKGVALPDLAWIGASFPRSYRQTDHGRGGYRR